MEDLATEISDPDLTKTPLLSIKATMLGLQGEFQLALELLRECKIKAQERSDLPNLEDIYYQI